MPGSAPWRALILAGGCALASLHAAAPGAVSPVAYRLTFPEAEHHWMQVEATFSDLDPLPLELRMSRSSPGRYALHDFAKNVYDVTVTASGRALAVARPDPYGWTVPDHPSSVIVRYKVFGDRVDGTYLGIDRAHAHINMPASIMFARGLDDRPATVTFVAPPESNWQVATQLHRGRTAFEYTAPNLQYLMDSPAEFGPLSIRTFQVDGSTFNFAAHHAGTEDELSDFVKDVEKLVRVEKEIFGEFPSYEPGHYTFLADYLPWASGDGMEHRNSTIVTSSASIRGNRNGLLDTVAHEFFHGWNIERIRPRSLEPFDFERANMSAELWLGEGFTQYYGPLAQSRAGLEDLGSTLDSMNGLLQSIIVNPGREYRSAAEMSQMASFTDGGRTIDRTNWANSFISYYPYGGALALALDLSLRERSQGRVTLDDYMRAMWHEHGKPSSREGYVERPYSLEDAQARLGEVSGDALFARDFFIRYVLGRELPDYARLLEPAGLALRRAEANAPWWGDLHLEERDGVRLAASPLSNTPAYKAGLDLDDRIRVVDGARVATAADVTNAIRRRKPGETLTVEFVDRGGMSRTARVSLERDPRLELVTIEQLGRKLSPAQISFRAAWLGRH